MFVAATTRSYQRAPDAAGFFVSGVTELFADTSSLCAAHYRRPSDGAWTNVQNVNNSVVTSTEVCWPVGGHNNATGVANLEDNIVNSGRLAFDVFAAAGISVAAGTPATQQLMPTLSDNDILLYPATIMTAHSQSSENTSETLIQGELEGVYWIPGTKSDGSVVAAEDTVTISSERYRIFPNVHRREAYSFFAVKEA